MNGLPVGSQRWRPEPLARGHRYPVYRAPVAHFVERIRERRPFAYTKINHGFWEKLLALHENPQPSAAAADASIGARYFVEGGFRDELLQMLRSLALDDPDLYFATSHLAYPGSNRHEWVHRDPAQVLALIRQALPQGFIPFDGLLWKQATITGEIRALYQELQPLQVTVIGPDWLSELQPMFGFRHFSQIPIHPREARRCRNQLIDRIQRHHDSLQGHPVAYLMQAGTLSPWLTLKLHRQLENAFFLDLGRALDICRPEKVFRQNWGRVFRREISTNMGVRDPNLRDSRRIFGNPRGTESPSNAPERPVRYVEDKPVDLGFVGKALAESSHHNQWTNFGPVNTRLEQAITQYLELPAQRRVVACASGTASLFALAALHEYRRRRPLRWVVSAFGFYPARQGPFRQARVVDCDERGMLDLSQLRRLDPKSYDAVMVTNLFGGAEDLSDYAEFCHDQGKILISDSALAFDAPYRRRPDTPQEAISFHHTKPWGMGEGGCVLIDREDEDVVRSLINFGIYRGHATGPLSTNAKLSDLAAAFILQRLRDFSDVSMRYHLQYARIVGLARQEGFVPLLGDKTLERAATPVNVPLLAPHPVPSPQLRNPTLVLRKYYEPLAPGFPAARDLYRRIVNVPCHPGMETLTAQEIRECLRRVYERSERVVTRTPRVVQPGPQPTSPRSA